MNANTPKLNTPELHVVVLAAGKGSRMHSTLPKVLHRVADKPLLAHVLDAAAGLMPTKAHIIIGHGKDQVKETFANYASSTKLEINWVEQAEQLGTGDAVKSALPFIPDNANVLMLTADVPLISTETLLSLSQAMASFSLTVLTAIVSDPTGLGRIIRDQENNMVGIIEQKDATPQQLAINEINSGIMCARSQHLKKWLMALNNDNAQQEYYLTDIVGLATAAGHLISAQSVKNSSEVEGINSRVQLAKVERVYQSQQIEKLMESGVTVIDPARLDLRGDVKVGTDTIIDINCVIAGTTEIGNNVQIGVNCIITNSKIADNSVIHANTIIESAQLGEAVNVGPFARLRPGTELANEVKIGNFVETKNAKLAAGAKANHLSYVGDSSVGENTNIGAGVITCNYDGANKHQTTIGSNVFVGSDSQLIAPVVIEDGATIAAGSTITNKVGHDQLALSRSRQRQIDNWQRPTKDKP